MNYPKFQIRKIIILLAFSIFFLLLGKYFSALASLCTTYGGFCIITNQCNVSNGCNVCNAGLGCPGGQTCCNPQPTPTPTPVPLPACGGSNFCTSSFNCVSGNGLQRVGGYSCSGGNVCCQDIPPTPTPTPPPVLYQPSDLSSPAGDAILCGYEDSGVCMYRKSNGGVTTDPNSITDPNNQPVDCNTVNPDYYEINQETNDGSNFYTCNGNAGIINPSLTKGAYGRCCAPFVHNTVLPPARINSLTKECDGSLGICVYDNAINTTNPTTAGSFSITGVNQTTNANQAKTFFTSTVPSCASMSNNFYTNTPDNGVCPNFPGQNNACCRQVTCAEVTSGQGSCSPLGTSTCSAGYVEVSSVFQYACTNGEVCCRPQTCTEVGGTCVNGFKTSGTCPSGYTYDPNAPSTLDNSCTGTTDMCCQPYSNFPACTQGGTICNWNSPTPNTCSANNTTGACETGTTGPQPCYPSNVSNFTGFTTTSNCDTGNGFNPSGAAGNGCVCQAAVSGHVFLDYNHDGSWDNAEPALTGISVSVQFSWNGGSATAPSNSSDGSYSYAAQQRSYTVQAIAPAGYQATNTQNITVNGTLSGIDVGLTPLYNISGIVYEDNNESQHYDGTDPQYTGADTVTLSGPVNETVNVSTDLAGHPSYNYIFPNLPAGQYQVTHTPPNGYSRKYPTFPSFTVVVGTPGTNPACNSGGYNDATCTGSGSITGLNFGIINSADTTTGTVTCSDVRDDNGVNVNVPSTLNCGNTVTPNYLQLSAQYCSTSTGIVMSGSTDPVVTGGGKLSASGWQVGDSTYPEDFSSRISGAITTSYGFLQTTIKESGITTTPLNTVCNLNSCDLSSIPNGIYTASQDVTLSQATIPDNTRIIIMVNGNLTIDGRLLAGTDSVDVFAVTGDITVDPSVGEASVTSTTTDVQGLFTTDQSFVIASAYAPNNRCNVSTDPAVDGTSKDLKLNILGAVITDAKSVNLGGGTFEDDRSLCKNNLSCPTTTITEPPPMLLNLPSVLLNTNNVFQEVAPGPGD